MGRRAIGPPCAPGPGAVVILNGAPRSGKSSIAAALQAAAPGPWMNLGVDAAIRATPEHLRPGIGLRPGGERPDLEEFVERGFLALYGSAAAHAREGLGVVMDVGHHEGHSRPLDLWPRCLDRLDGLVVLVVGVRCPLEEILRRRASAPPHYVRDRGAGIPAPILRWEAHVHRPGIYDLEVDTSLLTPAACAERILAAFSDAVEPDAAGRIRTGDGR